MPEDSSNNIKEGLKTEKNEIKTETKDNKAEKSYALYFIAVAFFIIIILIL